MFNYIYCYYGNEWDGKGNCNFLAFGKGHFAKNQIICIWDFSSVYDPVRTFKKNQKI